MFRHRPNQGDDLSSLSGSSISEISALLDVREIHRNLESPKFVLHLSTVPLASSLMVTHQKAIKKSHHGCLHCMVGKEMCISESCPCLELAKNAKHICYLEFLKKTGPIYWAREETRERIDPETVVVCPDNAGMFDERYSRSTRDDVGASGWKYVDKGHVVQLMNQMYWYRRYGKLYRADIRIEQLLKSRSVFHVRRILREVIQTLDGLLLKKFLIFSEELQNYHDIARSTARLFVGLLTDYTRRASDEEGRLLPLPNVSAYSECSNWFKEIKGSFSKPTTQGRMSWMDHEFKSKGLEDFFKPEVQQYKAIMEVAWAEMDLDTTETLDWVVRCTGLSRKRSLGHLPEFLNATKARDYRDGIVQPAREVDDLSIKMFFEDTVTFLTSYIRLDIGCLSEGENGSESLKDEVMSNLKIPVPDTASTGRTRSQGGKPEDARTALEFARDTRWKIPIRDLDTLDVLDTFTVDTVDDAMFQKPLFWISLEVLLHIFKDEEKFESYPDNPDLTKLIEGVFEGVVCHIDEPGKLRNLIKMSSILYWGTHPCASMCATLASKHESHECGLTGSNHAWRHYLRLGPDSDESDFVYDEDGNKKEEVWSFFTDFTAATDNIRKQFVVAGLSAFKQVAGCWSRYFDICIRAMAEPIWISDAISFSMTSFNGTWKAIRHNFSGWMQDGSPMGIYLTKIVLHTVHMVSRVRADLLYTEMTGRRIVKGQKRRKHVYADSMNMEFAEANSVMLVGAGPPTLYDEMEN